MTYRQNFSKLLSSWWLLLKKVKGVSHSLTVTGRAVWDHTVLPATRHKWTRPVLTPATKPVLDFYQATPEGAELTLAIPGNATAGVELATSRSQVRRSNHRATQITTSSQPSNSLLKFWRRLGKCLCLSRIKTSSLPWLQLTITAMSRHATLFHLLKISFHSLLGKKLNFLSP